MNVIRPFSSGSYFGVEECDRGRTVRFFAPVFDSEEMAWVFTHFLYWQRKAYGFDAEEGFEMRVAEALEAFLGPHLDDAVGLAVTTAELWAAFQCSDEWKALQPAVAVRR